VVETSFYVGEMLARLPTIVPSHAVMPPRTQRSASRYWIRAMGVTSMSGRAG
jgi:hypothetical protein